MGSSYRDLVRKVNEKKKATTAQQGREVAASATSGKKSSYQELVQRVNSGKVRFKPKMDSSQVDQWYKGVTEISAKGYALLQKEGYRAADSGISDSIGTYLQQAGDVANYLRANQDAFDNYEQLIKDHTATVTYLQQLKNQIQESNAHFSKWESEAEYQKDLQEYRRAAEENDRLLGMDTEQEAKIVELLEGFAGQEDVLKQYYLRGIYDDPTVQRLEKDLLNFKQMYGVQEGETFREASSRRAADLETAKRLQAWQKKGSVGDPGAENYDPEYDTISGQRIYAQPSMEELVDYDQMTDESSWTVGADGQYRDVFGNVVDIYRTDEKGNIIHPQTEGGKYDTTDRLGIFLNESQGNRAVTYDPASPIGQTWTKIAQEGMQKNWGYIKEEELQTYYYYLNKEGWASAEEYLNTIQEQLNQRAAGKDIAALQGKPVQQVLYNLGASWDSSAQNVHNYLFGKNEYTPATKQQFAAEAMRQEMEDAGNTVGKVAFDLAGTVGNMAPSILTSTLIGMFNPTAGAAVGAGLMGASAAGNAYQEKINAGYSEDQARTYGTMVGVSETVMEYLLGGISKLGGKGLQTVFKNLDKVDNVFARVAKSVPGKLMASGLSEAGEEYLQALIEPALWEAVSGEDMTADQEEALYNALLGFLSGGLFEGAEVIGSGVQSNLYNTARGQQIVDAGTVGSLQEIARSMDLSKQADRVSGETGAGKGIIAKLKDAGNVRRVGKLYGEVTQENIKRSQTDLANRLTEQGFSRDTALTLAETLVAARTGAALTSGQKALLQAVENDSRVTESVAGALANVFTDLQTESGQRNAKMELFRMATEMRNRAAGEPASENPVTLESLAEDMAEEENPENDNPPVTAGGDSPLYTRGPVESGLEDGKLLAGETFRRSTGEVVQVKTFTDFTGGKATVQLQDGTTASAEDISFNGNDDGPFHLIATEENMTAAAANQMWQLWKNIKANKLPVTAEQYGSAAIALFRAGWRNDSSILSDGDSRAAALSKSQRELIYEAGRKAARAKTDVQQANVDKVHAQAEKALGQAGASRNGTYRVVAADGLQVHKMTRQQKAAYEMASLIAPGVKGNMELYDGGKEWGYYDHKRDVIRLNINAKWNQTSMMAFTLGHELAHRAALGSPKKFQAFADFLVEKYVEQGTSLEELIGEQLQAADKFDRTLPAEKRLHMTETQALEEVVADACQRMLLDTDAGQRLAEFGAKSRENRRILQDIKKWIREFMDRVRRSFRNVMPDSKAAREFDRFDRQTKQLLADRFVDMTLDAGEKLSTVKAAGMTEKITTDRGGVRYKAGMTEADIKAVQNIGRISVNRFSTADIKATERFSRQYWSKMGEKSPFFRAWFGDWRANDQTAVEVADQKGDARGVQKNADTGWDIQVSGRVFNETKVHNAKVNREALAYLPYIDDIVRKAVLLDSYGIGQGREKSSNSLLMHSLYAVADIGNGPELLKIYVEEMNDPNKADTGKRAYQLQNIEKAFNASVRVQGNAPSSLTNTSNAINTVADLFAAVKQKDSNFQPNPASKVVNLDGRPMVMYHGTNSKFTYFDKRRARVGVFGKGFYFTPTESWAKAYGSAQIMETYLSVKNPYVIQDSLGFVAEDYQKMQKRFGVTEKITDKNVGRILRAQRYDGIMVYDGQGNLREVIAFEPTQIKSATDNSGTFDGSNSDVRYKLPVSRDVADRGELSAVKAAGMTEKITTDRGGVRYSINSDKVIDLSSNNELSERTAGLHGAEKYKEIQRYIIEVLQEQPIMLSDGREAVVDRRDALHIANRAGVEKTAQIAEIKRLVETAVLCASDTKAEHNKFSEFWYYKAEVRFKGQEFPLYVNVGKAINDGTYHIYDITQKIRDTADRINGLERPRETEGNALESGIFNNSIRNPEGNVNKKSETDAKMPHKVPTRQEYEGRERLAEIFEQVVKSADEYKVLERYRSHIQAMLNLEEHQRVLNEEIKRLSSAEEPIDRELLNKLKFQRQQAKNRWKYYDSLITSLSSRTGIVKAVDEMRAIMDREVSRLAKDRVAAAKTYYRERNEQRENEIRQYYRESRRQAVERHDMAEIRQRIRKDVQRLDSLLNKGNRNKNVKEGLREVVGAALRLANGAFLKDYNEYDMIRAGLKNDLLPKEKAAFDRCRELLQELERMNTEPSKEDIWDPEEVLRLEDREEALKRELSQNMRVLRDGNVFQREREGAENATAEALADELLAAYQKLAETEYEHLQGAYSDKVYQQIDTVKKQLSGKAIKDMTAIELRELQKLYRMIRETVSRADELFGAYRNQKTSGRGNRMQDELQTERDADISEIAAKIRELELSLLTPEAFAAVMGSPELTKAIRDVMEGEIIQQQDIEHARQYAAEQAEKFNRKNWDTSRQVKFAGTEITVGQAMALFVYMDREAGRNHISGDGFTHSKEVPIKEKKGKLQLSQKFIKDTTRAYRVTEDMYKELRALLTEDQRGYARAMRDYLAKVMGAKGNEVSMELYGIEMYGEKYYFPLKTAKEFRDAALGAKHGEVKATNQGFTKALQEGASNAIVLEDLETFWAKHVQEMSTYHALGVAMENFNRLYNYCRTEQRQTTDAWGQPVTEEVKSNERTSLYIERRVAGGSRYLTKWMENVNGGARSDATEQLLGGWLGTFRKTKVLGNTSVILQQPISILRAAPYLGKDFLAGWTTWKTTTPEKGLIREMYRYCPVAGLKKMGGFDPSAGQTVRQYLFDGRDDTKGKLKKGRDKTNELLGKAPELMDELAWSYLWLSCKKKTLRDNSSLRAGSKEHCEAAAKLFTQVVRETQVYDSVMSKPLILQSKKLAIKGLTSFMNEPMKGLNQCITAVARAKNGEITKAQAATNIACVAVSNLLATAVSCLIYALRDEDEDETYWEKYLKHLSGGLLDVLNPLNYFPIAKDIVSIVKGYGNERSELTPIADAWDGIKALCTGSKPESPEEREKAIWNRLDDLGNALNISGVPVRNLIREVRSIYYTIKRAGTIQATDTGVRYALLEGVTGNEVKKSEQLYNAVVEDDGKHLVRVMETWDDPKTAVSNLVSATKNAYLDGKITDDRAMEYLQEFGGKSLDQVSDYLSEWEFKKTYPDSELVDSNARNYIELAEPAGISLEIYTRFCEETDKDEDGNPIQNSKKEKVWEVIHGLPITREQKEALHYAAGYAESSLKDAPWN